MATLSVTSTSPSPRIPIAAAFLNEEDGLLRPDWLEKEWAAIDGMGTARNALAFTAVDLGKSTPGAIVAAIPVFQVVGGVLILHSAIKVTIPDSYRALKKAVASDEEIGRAEGIKTTALGFINQLLFGAIGGELLAAGVTGLMSPGAAHAMHYTAVIGSHATEALSNMVLGVTCVVRGSLMIGRSLYNLSYLTPFQKDLREHLLADNPVSKKIEESKAFLKEELALGKERFTRRVGTEAANRVEALLKNPEATEEEWKTCLELVDKGVFKQKFVQYLNLAIGILMVLGGIASIVFSGGLTIALIAGISCLLFMKMESLWLIYDYSPWLNKLVDKFYTQPDFWSESEAISEISSDEENLRLLRVSPASEEVA